MGVIFTSLVALLVNGPEIVQALLEGKEGKLEEEPEKEKEADLPLDVILRLKWASNPQATKKKTQWITWIGDKIDETPGPKPKFPASDLRLEFEIIDRFKDEQLAGLDRELTKLTANFPFHELKRGTNLCDRRFVKRRGEPPDKHRFLNMESDTKTLVKGWFVLDEPLTPGKHTITLTATDRAKNTRTIALVFTTTALDLGLQLEWPEKKEQVKKNLVQVTEWKDGNTIIKPTPPPKFPASGLQLDFQIESLPRDPKRRAGIIRESVNLTADFECEGVKPGENLVTACKSLQINSDTRLLITGQLLITQPLEYGGHTLTLEAIDEFGNSKGIRLEFTSIVPHLMLHLRGGRKSQWVENIKGKLSEYRPLQPDFPPSDLLLSYMVKGLPEPLEECAWLDKGAIKLTADFPYGGFPANKKNLLDIDGWWGSRTGNKVEHTRVIREPLKDGEHRLRLVAADKLGNQNEVELAFTASQEFYNLRLVRDVDKSGVHRWGEVLQEIMLNPVSEAGAKQDPPGEWCFYVQIFDPTQEIDEKLGGRERESARKKTLTAVLESLDSDKECLWGPHEVTLERIEPSSICFRSKKLFAAYEKSEKPLPAGAKAMAVPAVVNGTIRATLKSADKRKVELPVRRASLKIEWVRAYVDDKGPDEELVMSIHAKFRLEGIVIPDPLTMGMTLSGGKLDKPLNAFGHAHKVEHLSGSGARGLISFVPHFEYGVEDVFDSEATYTLTFYAGDEPDERLPQATAKLPACSIERLLVQIGRQKITEWEQLRPVNPYAPPDISTLVQFRPTGNCVRGKTRIRAEFDDKTFDGEPETHPNLRAGKDKGIQWKPSRDRLEYKAGVLAVSLMAAAEAKECNSLLCYRVLRKIPLRPRVDSIERGKVEIEYLPEGSEKPRIHTTKHPGILDQKHKMAIPPGATVTVTVAASAVAFDGEKYPVIDSVPLTWTLQAKGSGYRLLEPGLKSGELATRKETYEGRSSVTFQVPADVGEAGQKLKLIVCPDESKGEPVAFDFIVVRAITEVIGPRVVVVNSRPTYEVKTAREPKPGEETEWALFEPTKSDPDPATPTQQGKGQKFRCHFKSRTPQVIRHARIRFPRNTLVVRHRGDEQVVELGVSDIQIAGLPDRLGHRRKCSVRLSPFDVPGELEWRWSLSLPDGSQVKITPETEPDSGQDSTAYVPRMMVPGEYKLTVAVEGGRRDFAFSIDPMRIHGPRLLAVGEPGAFEVIPDDLDHVEWFLYKDGMRQGKGRMSEGPTWKWRPDEVGDYRLTARWERWAEVKENEQHHVVIVAEIRDGKGKKAKDRIALDKTEAYTVAPHELRGRSAEWQVTYVRRYEQHSETLIEKEGQVKLHNSGEYDYCILEATFSGCPGLKEDVIVTKEISLSEWRGNAPCEWKMDKER